MIGHVIQAYEFDDLDIVKDIIELGYPLVIKNEYQEISMGDAITLINSAANERES